MESNHSERKKQNDEQNRMELPESLNYLANSDAAQAAIAFNKSTMPSVLPEVELIGHILPRESSSSKERDEPTKDCASKGGKRVFCEKVTQGEFSEYGKKLIEKFDTEKKGFLTKDQIVKQLENPSIQGKEAQALGAMYKNFSSLEKLTSQKSMWDSPGISYEDLNKFKADEIALGKAFQEYQSIKNFASYGTKKFDTDSSNSLTRSELDAALANAKTSDADRKSLQMLRDNFSQIGSVLDRSIDNKSINEFADRSYAAKENSAVITAVSVTCSDVSSSQRMEISHDLFADKNDPLKSITPEGIKQGGIGNCYFLAALGSLAQSNPAVIRDSIKENADGTYTVTFKGAPHEPVTVKAPSQAELGLFNHGSSNGTWASVMEKAYGSYCQQAFYRRSFLNPGGGNVPAEGGDGGGFSSSSMKFLSGNSVSGYTSTFSGEERMASKLEDAFRNKKMVTASIDGSLINSHSADGFPRRHAFSVVDFRPDGNKSGSVTIRNPWAKGEGVNGKITISLAQFRKNFTDLSIED